MTMDAGELAEAVAVGNVPTLLLVLTQLTGDQSWLDEPYRPTRTRGMAENDSGGLSAELQQRVRSAALDALLAWSAGAPVAIPTPSPQLMARMLATSMGDEVPDEYGLMLLDDFRRSMGADPIVAAQHVPADFCVVIVGAGITGIAAAVAMKRMGVPYVVLERSSTLGGVWRDNEYPGAGVDTPSHLYSYSFMPYDWEHYFADRGEIVDYLERVVELFDLRRNIRFGVTVDEARFDGTARQWVLRTSGAAGIDRASVLITAVGAFARPKLPAVPGVESFAGPLVHTAAWPTDLDVVGKRVAVIGNGASAMQVVPAIVDRVDSLTIFQRQAQWAQPFDKLHMKVPQQIRALMREVPLYRAWYRLRLAWIFHDKLHGALQCDPSWPDQTRSINSANDRHRKFLTDYIVRELGERTDLLDRAVPDYPPFGKRMLMDNGWFRALRRQHTRLVDDPIERIVESGVITSTGELHEVDVIVAASGFDVVRFLSTIAVVGPDGRSLRAEWDDDNCAAYLGLAIPGFPNLFTLYGPNTQPGHGGSLITTVEHQLDYVCDVLRHMFDNELATVECRRQVYDDYVARVDDAHSRMVWTHPGMSTYYRNSRGRVVVNSPFRNLDFWRMTRTPAVAEAFVAQPRVRGGVDDAAQ